MSQTLLSTLLSEAPCDSLQAFPSCSCLSKTSAEYAQSATQLMGDLSSSRVQPPPPFTKTGTDFTGPITLKKGHTRKPVFVKGYICLFVCELVTSVHRCISSCIHEVRGTPWRSRGTVLRQWLQLYWSKSRASTSV